MRAISRAAGPGRPAAVSPPSTIAMSPSSVTRPMTAAGRPQRAQTASTAASRSGSTIAHIRSCDSLIITSNGAMPGSRRGIASRSTSIPVPPRSASSDVAQVIPPAPRSWRPSTRPPSMSSRLASMSSFSANGSPDLDRRALRRVVVGERRRGEDRRAADPVAPGRRAEQDDEIARAGRAGQREPLERQEADGHDVDERVAAVRGIEDELAADGRHADAVAVAADAPDDPVDEVAGPRVGRIAEAQRVEDRDRPGAHREDVAQDPADAGRGALVRLDRRGVVVRFDLERDAQAVADVDDAGVLARAGDDPFAARRQGAQERPRALVAAVLAPHDAEHRELEVVGRAAELDPDRRELLVGDARGPGGAARPAPSCAVAGASRPGAIGSTVTGRPRRPGPAAEARSAADSTSERRIGRPSAEPRIPSAARSGWGIRPATLPPGASTPAIAWSDPLGFASGSLDPAGRPSAWT